MNWNFWRFAPKKRSYPADLVALRKAIEILREAASATWEDPEGNPQTRFLWHCATYLENEMRTYYVDPEDKFREMIGRDA